MAKRKKDKLTLVAVGDVSPNREDPPSIFRYCRDVFHTGDVVFGHLEYTLSAKVKRMLVKHRPFPLAPHNVSALTERGAGFHVMSFAANASMDYGLEAFLDTLDIAKKNNITLVGAGKNIEEARKPAIVERNGTKIGFLAYLSIIHRDNTIAKESTAGCLPLRASHSFEQVDHQPGTPPQIVTKLFPEDRQAMETDIRKLRPQVDVLVVSMHCGVHFAPAIIAMYQKEAAHAAVDCGADLVLQHHAHILKGIEVYKGKVIFYGLGNFAVEHIIGPPSKSAFYRIKAQPGYEKHFFPHDSLKTIMVKAYIHDKNIQKVTYIPAYIRPTLEPEVVRREDPRAQEIFDYVVKISESEDLEVDFSWEGDEVLIR